MHFKYQWFAHTTMTTSDIDSYGGMKVTFGTDPIDKILPAGKRRAGDIIPPWMAKMGIDEVQLYELFREKQIEAVRRNPLYKFTAQVAAFIEQSLDKFWLHRHPTSMQDVDVNREIESMTEEEIKHHAEERAIDEIMTALRDKGYLGKMEALPISIRRKDIPDTHDLEGNLIKWQEMSKITQIKQSGLYKLFHAIDIGRQEVCNGEVSNEVLNRKDSDGDTYMFDENNLHQPGRLKSLNLAELLFPSDKTLRLLQQDPLNCTNAFKYHFLLATRSNRQHIINMYRIEQLKNDVNIYLDLLSTNDEFKKAREQAVEEHVRKLQNQIDVVLPRRINELQMVSDIHLFDDHAADDAAAEDKYKRKFQFFMCQIIYKYYDDSSPESKFKWDAVVSSFNNLTPEEGNISVEELSKGDEIQLSESYRSPNLETNDKVFYLWRVNNFDAMNDTFDIERNGQTKTASINDVVVPKEKSVGAHVLLKNQRDELWRIVHSSLGNIKISDDTNTIVNVNFDEIYAENALKPGSTCTFLHYDARINKATIAGENLRGDYITAKVLKTSIRVRQSGTGCTFERDFSNLKIPREILINEPAFEFAEKVHDYKSTITKNMLYSKIQQSQAHWYETTPWASGKIWVNNNCWSHMVEAHTMVTRKFPHLRDCSMQDLVTDDEARFPFAKLTAMCIRSSAALSGNRYTLNKLYARINMEKVKILQMFKFVTCGTNRKRKFSSFIRTESRFPC